MLYQGSLEIYTGVLFLRPREMVHERSEVVAVGDCTLVEWEW